MDCSLQKLLLHVTIGCLSCTHVHRGAWLAPFKWLQLPNLTKRKVQSYFNHLKLRYSSYATCNQFIIEGFRIITHYAIAGQDPDVSAHVAFGSLSESSSSHGSLVLLVIYWSCQGRNGSKANELGFYSSQRSSLIWVLLMPKKHIEYNSWLMLSSPSILNYVSYSCSLGTLIVQPASARQYW